MFIKIVRLGKDSEVRSTPSGKQVLQFNAAYDVGYGDQKRTQWINVSYWRDNADKLASYLLKGLRVQVECSEVYIEEWESNGEKKFMLKGNASNLTLIDKPEQAAQQERAPQTKAQTKPTQQSNGFDDLEDLPF